MKEIPLSDFLNRVISSKEKVQFSFVDPYGHMNASRYLESILNHRIHACEEHLACFTMDIAKLLNQAFVLHRIDLRYLKPSFLSENLEIGSWVKRISADGFSLSICVSNPHSKSVRVVGILEFKSVDLKTGKSVAIAPFLPSRSEEELIQKFPLASEYTAQLKDYPSDLL
jgi:acyl-CoA thioesterase FadM